MKPLKSYGWISLIPAYLFLAVFINNPVALSQEQASIKDEAKFVWDFGKVKEGQVLSHNFIFKNESKKPLIIKELHSSCGCTVSEAQKKELSPGESTPIEVKFKSKGYSGNIRQFVYLHTDSPDEPIIRFVVIAEVVK